MPITRLTKRAACGHLGTCLGGRAAGDETVGQVTVSSRQPFCEVTATEGPDLALVDVALRLEDDGENTPSAHTVILFHHGPAGWCAAAEVLEPTWPVRAYCETQHELRRVSATESSLRTRRTCHESLDQEELAAGVSDVTGRECVDLGYSTGAQGIEEVSRRACDRSGSRE